MSVSRHTTYNLLGSMIPIVLALVTVPIYLKLVGPDRYGVLAIAWLLLGYFGLFDLGLGRATSFRIAALRNASSQARADTFWAALSVNLGMGIVGGAVLWAAASFFFGKVFKVDEHLRPEILQAVPFLAAAVPIATLTGVLTGAMQGREKFLETNTISVLSTTLFQLFPLSVAWKFGPNLVLLLSAAVSARILALMVMGYRCHVELTRGQQRRLIRSEIPLLMKYGGWVTLSSVFGPMLVIVDRFAIGAILGAVSVTVYTVPFQLAQRVAILPSALTNALFPKMSAASVEERNAMVHSASLALASLVSLPVLGAIYLLDPFLDLWVGASMGAKAAPIGRILLIGFWANAFALVPFMRLQSTGRPDLVTKMLIVQIPPYLLCLYLGMTYLGLAGSALAFSARCIADYALLTWVSGRDFRTLPLLGLNFSLLVGACFISEFWTISQWEWWGSAITLAAVMLTIGLRTLPHEVRSQLLGRIGALRRRGESVVINVRRLVSAFRRRFLGAPHELMLGPRYPQYEIGRGSYGGLEVLEFGEGAELHVGAYCSFAKGSQIFLGGEHRTEWVTTYPFSALDARFVSIKGHPKSRGDVRIGNDVWMGREAMIMSGVTVGDGAVIGARAVVTRDVAPYAIVAGNPATFVRLRFSEEIIARLLAVAWWNWPTEQVDAAVPLLLANDIEGFLDAAESGRI